MRALLALVLCVVSLAAAAAGDFDRLPLELAVKIQRGDGHRVMAVFSDPNCGACRKFERELGQIDDITIYVFMYPVIRPELADQSRAIWCSRDRAKAWLALAAKRPPRAPRASPDCDNPVDRVLALGKRLRVRMTPTVILPNGLRFSGGLHARSMTSVLDESQAQLSGRR